MIRPHHYYILLPPFNQMASQISGSWDVPVGNRNWWESGIFFDVISFICKECTKSCFPECRKNQNKRIAHIVLVSGQTLLGLVLDLITDWSLPYILNEGHVHASVSARFNLNSEQGLTNLRTVWNRTKCRKFLGGGCQTYAVILFIAWFVLFLQNESSFVTQFWMFRYI